MAGATVLPGDGFVAAAFRHRTSRAGDPHLHIHVVVANLAHARTDDRWSALDGRHLYSWCRTVGFLRMALVGILGGHGAQVATYATRENKDTSVPYDALQEWWVQRAAMVGLGSHHVVALAEPGTERIHRSEGRRAPVPIDVRRWTTPDLLAVEKHFIEMATHRRGVGAGLARADHVEAAITACPTLGDEQQAMVRRICCSGDGVEVVPGVGGSGKTHALAAASDTWVASGRTVTGTACARSVNLAIGDQ